MTSSIPADDGSAAVPIKRPPPVEFSTREFREAITRKDADAVGAQIDALVAAGGPAWSNELERELMRSGLRTIDPVRCVDVSTWIAGNSKGSSFSNHDIFF